MIALGMSRISPGANFLVAAKFLVKPTGRICLVYHVSRLAEISTAASSLRLAPLRLQFVHGGPEDGDRMVMLELVKGRSRELSVLPPLSSLRRKVFKRSYEHPLPPHCRRRCSFFMAAVERLIRHGGLWR